MPPVSEPKTKPVRLDLSEEGHRYLRVLASIEGTNMAAFARELVEAHVRGEVKKRGLKI